MAKKKNLLNKKIPTNQKLRKKTRNIYALSTEIFYSNEDFSKTTGAWNKELCDDLVLLLQKLNNMDMEEKLYKDELNNFWSMYLESITLEDAVTPTYFKGYFYSTSDTLRTDLLNNITNEISPNPKKKGQNEIHTTCFALRFSDGLLLLGDYGGNVVTVNRLSDYLTKFAKQFGTKNNINQISFNYIVSKEFLEKLNSFKKLNSLELTIDTTQVSGYDDAISALDNETKQINQKSITLLLKQDDKLGLLPNEIHSWVSDKIKTHSIVQGKIQGKPLPGNPKKFELKGIKEKYSESFEIDDKGEVLIEPLFNSIIKKIEDRPKLH